MTKKFVFLFVTKLLLTQLSFSQQNKVQKLDSVFAALHSKGKFNGNILIADKGEVVYKNSYGFANETTKEKLIENSIFELASVSKQFTAMAIVLLKKAGKLNYEDKLDKFIPALNFYENITIRNLLNHTGGLPDYMAIMDTLFDKSKIATNKDMISIFAKAKPAILFKPNTKYEYSNTGYALLASIIEKVSGVSYKNYLDKAIFKPLQMTNSFVYNRRLAPRKIKNYAFGYIYNEKAKKNLLPDDYDDTNMVIWLDGIVGDGTVNSTIGDLLKWDKALYTDVLINDNDRKEIFSMAVLENGKKSNYGFGWQVDNNKTFGRIVSHTGSWPGYATYIERNVDSNKTIILLQNNERSSFPIKQIRDVLYSVTKKNAVKENEVFVSKDIIEKYLGEYELGPEVIIKIFWDNDVLKTQLTGQKAFPIFAKSETVFFLKVVEAQLEFVKDKDGKVTNLTLLQNGNSTEALKIK
jgi:CubicO group peptidase (beta-lactamase class C family)